MNFKLGLKNKIIITLILATFIAGILAVFVINYVAKTEVENLRRDDYKIIADGYSHELEEVLNGSLDLVKNISQDEEIKNYLKEEKPLVQDPSIIRIIEKQKIIGKHAAIYLMKRNGEVLVSTDESFLEKNYNFRSYFQDAIQNNWGSEVAIGATSGELGYYFASSIINDLNEEILGVIVVKMVPDVVDEGIRNHSTENAEVMLIDASGVIIHSVDPELEYKSLYNVPLKGEVGEKLEKKFAGTEIKSLEFEKLKKIVENREHQTINLYDQKEGGEVMFVLAPLEKYPFTVLIKTKLTEMKSAVNLISFYLVISVIGAIIIIISVIMFFIPRFLRPLGRLEETVRKISAGELEIRAKVETKDEVGNLAKAFNLMVDRLVREKKLVDEKIQERTAELEKINKFMTGRELRMIELKKEIINLKEKLKNNKD